MIKKIQTKHFSKKIQKIFVGHIGEASEPLLDYMLVQKEEMGQMEKTKSFINRSIGELDKQTNTLIIKQHHTIK